MKTPVRDHCIRCGTCCSKGGPTLHLEDLELFHRSVLKPAHVYTLRSGETVYHNILERLVPLDHELIKIKEVPGGRSCMFYDPGRNRCSIYDNRPVQCRALACWDTRELELVFTRPKLSRNSFLPPGIPILDIIEAHDRRCHPGRVIRLAKQLSHSHDEEIVRAIIDTVQYDAAMRPFMSERLGLDPSELDFFFGRPLSLILEACGLRIVERDGIMDIDRAG